MTASQPTPAGDELLPAANLIFDRRSVIDATPEQIWPWLLQLGKHRAGWYLPAALERLLPERHRASHRIEPDYQNSRIGDRIPDYGGRRDWLEVACLDPPHALVYRTERRGRPFTWGLLLTPISPSQTELRLRFRGQIRSRRALRRAIIATGGFLDWGTGELMVRGLRERVDRPRG